MRKGFGFYSPHETTMFFLKALLLSFWLGVDLIAALIATTLPPGSLAQHGLLSVIAITILISGTVFSALFAWATGALFGREMADLKTNFVAARLHALKQRPGALIVAGIASASLLLSATAGLAIFLRPDTDAAVRTGRANVAVATRCAEIAHLEGRLFRSSEQTVMAECLIQYDEKYASLRSP